MHILFAIALSILVSFAAAEDAMFSPEGTLAHRVALETGVSDACAAALLRVENEPSSRALIQAVDRACHEEVEDAIMAGNFLETSPDGAIAIHLNGVTLFVRTYASGIDVEPVVEGVAPVTWE